MIKSINADERKIAQARYAEDLERLWNTERDLAVMEGIGKGKEEGLIEGLEKGKKEQAYETAKKLKNLGLPIETIVSVTNLTKEESEKL